MHKSLIYNAVLSDTNFSIVDGGRRKKLHINNTKVSYEKNSKAKSKDEILSKFAPSFFKNLQNYYNNYILEKNYNIEPIFEEHKLIHSIKRDNWKAIDNDRLFVKVDIEHAYWQILFNMGIIPKKFYEENLHPDFKLLRNMSIGYMIRKQVLKYYNPKLFSDELINDIINNKVFDRLEPCHKINCDTEIYNIIFKNIRQTSANTIGEVAENILDGKFVKYVVDGITFKPKDNKQLKDVYQYLKFCGFTFTTNFCRKISDKEYNEKGKIKNL